MTDRDRLQPTYVLHRRPYSNSSLLLECFTLDEGRMPIIAAGAKRPKSNRVALLQPFVPLLASWSGRGEIKTLRHCEAASTPHALQGNALFCGFYLNELLVRLLQRNAPHEHLFGIYSDAVRKLSNGPSLNSLLRHFELDLLEQLGLGLVLDRCADDDSPLRPDGRYYYLPEVGPVTRDDGHGLTVSGSTLLALARRQALAMEGEREARALMRHILSYYLGDRPLKSRELFQAGGK